MTYSPNLPISSGWKSTLANAFQTLRRVKFIVEETFSFGDFNPQTNYNGMAATGLNEYRARYLKIGKFFLFSYDSLATVAAPFTNNVTITIPYTVKGDRQQGGGAVVSNGGAGESGFFTAVADTNTVIFHRVNDGNWGAGFLEIVCNGFIEIK
jgi:hypothetical protein